MLANLRSRVSLAASILVVCGACTSGGRMAPRGAPAQGSASAPATAAPPTEQGEEGEEPAVPAEPARIASSCAPLASSAGPDRARQMIQTRHSGSIRDMAISRAGNLATVGQDGTLRFWNLPQRTLLRSVPLGDRMSAHTIAWISGDELAAGDAKRTVHMTVDGGVRKELKGTSDFILRPDGPIPQELERDWSKNVFVYEDRAGKTHHLKPKGKLIDSTFDSFFVNQDDDTLIGLYTGRVGVSVWSLKTEPSDAQLIGFGGAAKATAYLPKGDGLLVAAGAVGVPAKIFKVSLDGKTKPSTWMDQVDPSFLAVSPDGRLVAMGTFTGIEVRELATTKLLLRDVAVRFDQGRGRFDGEPFRSASFSPDGRYVVAARGDGGLSVYDTVARRKHGELGWSVRSPKQIAFAGDTRLVSASREHVTTWSLKTGLVRTTTQVDYLADTTTAENGDVVTARNRRCGPRVSLFIDRWQGIRAPDGLIDTATDWTEHCPVRVPSMTPPALWPPPAGRGEWPFEFDTQGIGLDELVALDLPASAALFFGNREEKRGILTTQASVYDLASKKWVTMKVPAGAQLADRPRLVGKYVQNRIQHLPPTDNVFFDAALWDRTTGEMMPPLHVQYDNFGTPSGSTDLAAVTPDGGHFVALLGAQVAARAVPSGPVKQFKLEVDGSPSSVIAMNGGEELFVGTRNGSLHRVRGDKTLFTGKSNGGPIVQIVVDGPGKRVATVSGDGAVRVWDAGDGTLRATLVDFDDDESIAFTANGAYSGTAEVAERVSWVFDGPPEAFRFEQFTQYRSPKTISARLAGEGVDVDVQTRRPPRIERLTGRLDAAKGSATISAHVQSTAQVETVNVYDEGIPSSSTKVCAPARDLAVDVPLLPGLNRVAVSAFDDRGQSSNTEFVDLVGPAVSGARPALYVTAIGVSSYPKLAEEFQLGFAHADASALAEALQGHAGDGKSYASVDTKVLLNDAVTPESVLAALDRLKSMTPRDVAIVFLAGHGVKSTMSADMRFLTSTASESREGFETGGIGWKQIGEKLAAAKGRVIVILDACHSGHLSQELVVPNNSLALSLQREQRAGVLVFAAAKGRQPSLEPRGSRGVTVKAADRKLLRGADGHGIFTAALLASLADPMTDRNGDGSIEVSELLDEVTGRVTTVTKGRQTPWVTRRELFGDFSFVGAASAGTP